MKNKIGDKMCWGKTINFSHLFWVVIVTFSIIMIRFTFVPQDEEDEDEEDGLSKSGKELKKLLCRISGLNESEAEDDDDVSRTF